MAETLILRAAKARHRDLVHDLARSLREARLDRGVSQRAVAAAAGIDHALLSRIEAGRDTVTIPTLIAIATALGMEPSIRLFPATGPRIHDRMSAPITDALLNLAHPRWQRRLEVGVTRPSRGVIDLVLSERDGPDVVAGEIQGQLRRVEQQIRRAGEKADSLSSAVGWPWSSPQPRISRLLVLRSTAETRALVRSLPALFRAAYPAAEADAYAALTQDRLSWPGHALLWAEVSNGRGRILDGPPRASGR
jgi:transcriptional regulator with XRE-family HTH domain